MSNLPGPNPEEPKYDGRVSPAKVAGDVAFLQKAASQIVKMHERDGKLPEGMTESELHEIEVVAQMDVLPAKAAAMGAMTGLIQGEALYVMWSRARNALQLLGMVALMRLADKMDNSRAPGDTRVLLKIVEWAGLPTPQEAPKSDSERLDQMTQADAAKLTDQDLHEKLMAALRKGKA